MKTLHEDPYLKVTYDDELICMGAKWKKYAPSQSFRTSMIALARQVAYHRPSSLCFDARLLKIVAPEDQIWLAETWLREYIGSPACEIYVLDAQDPFGKMSVQNMMRKAQEQTPGLALSLKKEPDNISQIQSVI